MGTLRVKAARDEAAGGRADVQAGAGACRLVKGKKTTKKKGKVVIFDSRMKGSQLRNY